MDVLGGIRGIGVGGGGGIEWAIIRHFRPQSSAATRNVFALLSALIGRHVIAVDPRFFLIGLPG